MKINIKKFLGWFSVIFWSLWCGTGEESDCRFPGLFTILNKKNRYLSKGSWGSAVKRNNRAALQTEKIGATPFP
ncbi:hypothetical protein QQF73_06655 [Marinobacter sp. M216]|uniref:Uncharacterized protein n=1 Tax=Marinobacter albus TaxID=3030833 RepID=A0ABT7HAD1_9GAMM|nr:hypothetical protein [Marinobacter sp. M216]MDK9557304.1 hypothetical protein [Marinobacter sp. M216]